MSRTLRGWSNRSVVRERDPAQARATWFLLALLLIAVAPVLVYQFFQNRSLELARELEHLHNEREALREEEWRLNLERVRLSSLSRIEDWALDERGMVRPGDDAVCVVAPVTPSESDNRTPLVARSREDGQ